MIYDLRETRKIKEYTRFTFSPAITGMRIRDSNPRIKSNLHQIFTNKEIKFDLNFKITESTTTNFLQSRLDENKNSRTFDMIL